MDPFSLLIAATVATTIVRHFTNTTAQQKRAARINPSGAFEAREIAFSDELIDAFHRGGDAAVEAYIRAADEAAYVRGRP